MVIRQGYFLINQYFINQTNKKMELKDFIQNFADQFDETDASVFTAETVFHELEEYSSLIALSIIAMIDEEYDVTIKGDEMRAAVTIEDLFNTVKSKM